LYLGQNPKRSIAMYSAVVTVFLALSVTQAQATQLPTATAMLVFTPFDSFFTSFETFMTGTVARVGSLAAIVGASLAYAHGSPTAKKLALGAGLGTIGANLAAKCLTWFTTGS